jgi:hypothetical protein
MTLSLVHRAPIHHDTVEYLVNHEIRKGVEGNGRDLI